MSNKLDKSWTEFGSNNSGTIPTSANEVLCVACWTNSSNNTWAYTVHIPVVPYAYGKRYFDGYHYSNSASNYVTVVVNSAGLITLGAMVVDGTNVLATAVMKLYYR